MLYTYFFLRNEDAAFGTQFAKELSSLEEIPIRKADTHAHEGTNVDKKIVLLGSGGSGKTTAARRYARSEKFKIIWELNAEESETLIHS
jgi:hypothetical protein